MKAVLIVVLLGLAGCDPAPARARSSDWQVSDDPLEDPPIVVVPAHSAGGTIPEPDVVVASATAVASARPVGCGTTRSRPCPLQAMMRGTAQAAVARGDFAAMEAALSRIGQLEPRGYSGWSDIAARGMRAARERDKAGVQAACSGCHALFRETFRASPLRSMQLY